MLFSRKTIKLFLQGALEDDSYQCVKARPQGSAFLALFEALELSELPCFYQMFTQGLLKSPGSLLTPVTLSASHNDVHLHEIASKETLSESQYLEIFKAIKPYFSEQGFALEKASLPHFRIKRDDISTPNVSLYRLQGVGLTSFMQENDGVAPWFKRLNELQLLLSNLSLSRDGNLESAPYNALWTWANTSAPTHLQSSARQALFCDDEALFVFARECGLRVDSLSSLTIKSLKKIKDPFVFLRNRQDLTSIESMLPAKQRLLIHAQNGIWQKK